MYRLRFNNRFPAINNFIFPKIGLVHRVWVRVSENVKFHWSKGCLKYCCDQFYLLNLVKLYWINFGLINSLTISLIFKQAVSFAYLRRSHVTGFLCYIVRKLPKYWTTLNLKSIFLLSLLLLFCSDILNILLWLIIMPIFFILGKVGLHQSLSFFECCSCLIL